MPNKLSVTFRVRSRERGGAAAGKTLSADVPGFELDTFMKTPNAREFIKKAYFAEVKKIIREIDEKKSGTVRDDLQSYETVVARSLSFTQVDIRDWFDSRDWSLVKDIPNLDQRLPKLREHLQRLSSRRNHISAEQSAKIAEMIIAPVADVEDPVAEFLFTTLTTPRTDSDDDLLLY